MCDTQVLVADGATWFAKNSDREPGEPQPVVRLPPVRGAAADRVRTTWIEIDEVPDRFGVLLSKPSWIWGAEMGANDQGVVVGNEAIFSRAIDRRPALLGMDLVRLGLERAATALDAVKVITALLEHHGQGGPAGYRNRSFRYDNSFLAADATEAWVLETAGRHWVAKRVTGTWAISNCLTLRDDWDLASDGLETFAREHGWKGRGKVDFARTFDTRLMPFLAGAHRRVALSRSCLADTSREGPSFTRFAAHLRRHERGNEAPLAGGNGDVCLHAAGLLRPSQTTGSMISRLAPGDARHVLTGTSAPCLALFRPASLEAEQPLSIEAGDAAGDPPLWRRFESVHRRALFDPGLRARLRAERDALEEPILASWSAVRSGGHELLEAERGARDWDAFCDRMTRTSPLRPSFGGAGLFWRLQNRLDDVR